MELVFDTIIFILTVARTMYVHTHTAAPVPNAPRGQRKTSLVVSLARDGAFYFAAIFSVNLAWVLMILYAPTGLRAIASVCVDLQSFCAYFVSSLEHIQALWMYHHHNDLQDHTQPPFYCLWSRQP